jgi:hypothetical protein
MEELILSNWTRPVLPMWEVLIKDTLRWVQLFSKNSKAFMFARNPDAMKVAYLIHLPIFPVLSLIFDGAGLVYTTLRPRSGSKNVVVVIPRMNKTRDLCTMNLDELWQSLSMVSFH